MDRTYRIDTLYGKDRDAEIRSNGGTYHKVIVEDIDDGSRVVKRFYSREKAYAFARQAIQ